MKGRVEQNSGEYRRFRLVSWGYVIVVALIVVGLMFTLWFQSIQITDNGMAPVLHKGDILLFDKLAKHVRAPQRGDAYAFRNEAGGVSLGRIVGLPGESVQVSEGDVYINGVLLNENNYVVPFDGELDEVVLSRDEFFLMPDDRTVAVLDGSAMTVTFDMLIGRASARVAPWDSIAVFFAG